MKKQSIYKMLRRSWLDNKSHQEPEYVLSKELPLFARIKIQFYRKYRNFRRRNFWYCHLRSNVRYFFGWIKDGNKWLRSVGEPDERSR